MNPYGVDSSTGIVRDDALNQAYYQNENHQKYIPNPQSQIPSLPSPSIPSRTSIPITTNTFQNDPNQSSFMQNPKSVIPNQLGSNPNSQHYNPQSGPYPNQPGSYPNQPSQFPNGYPPNSGYPGMQPGSSHQLGGPNYYQDSNFHPSYSPYPPGPYPYPYPSGQGQRNSNIQVNPNIIVTTAPAPAPAPSVIVVNGGAVYQRCQRCNQDTEQLHDRVLGTKSIVCCIFYALITMGMCFWIPLCDERLKDHVFICKKCGIQKRRVPAGFC